MRILLRFLQLRQNPRGFACLFLTAVVTNLLLIAMPILQKSLLNQILEGRLLHRELLFFLITGFGLIAVSLVEITILVQTKIALQKSITLDLLESLSITESPVIRTRGSGAFMSSIFGDAEQISNQLLGSNLFLGVGNLLSTLVILGLTYHWMPLFPLLIIVSYVLAILSMCLIQKKRAVYFDQGRQEIYKLNPVMLETIENRGAIMSHATLNTRKRLIEEGIQQRDRNFLRAMVLGKLGSGCLDSIKQVFLVLFFILALYQILEKRLEISSFIAMNSYFSAVYLPLYFFKSLNDSKTVLEVLYKRNQTSFDAQPRLLLPRGFEVSIRDVSLQYGETQIYDHISLDLDRLYGVVGLSGEGKSSLFSLLLGSEKPTSGQIQIGKHEVSEYDLHMRLNLFRYYPQENEIFQSDLHYNLTLGKTELPLEGYLDREKQMRATLQRLRSGEPGRGLPEYEILLNSLQVARDASRYSDFAHQLQIQLQESDDGELDTLAQMIMAHNYYVQEDYEQCVAAFELAHLQGRPLGQRGKQISGGEKNRICMARMLLIRNPAPFLIDEPFTSLDLISESKNAEVLRRHLVGQRGLIISHKIDLLKKLTDQILVIQQGRIEAVGTHDALVACSPTYRRLYEEYRRKNQEYIQPTEIPDDQISKP